MKNKEERDWELISTISDENGKSRDIIQCPFCGNEVAVYRWSFAAVGKKCECGALFSSGGYSTKKR